jgi:hypothetical protein
VPPNSFDIEKFAKVLISARDAAIISCITNLTTTRDYTVAQRWRSATEEDAHGGLKSTIIPDAIDSAIFALLTALENEEFELFVRDGRKYVSLAEAGDSEMAGEYIGDDGWRERFSTLVVNSFV